MTAAATTTTAAPAEDAGEPAAGEALPEAAVYPCGRCGRFHGSETGYCAACSGGLLQPDVVAKAGRLQRRAYLATVTIVMSYFETDDRFVLAVFVGACLLIVMFYLLTRAVASEEPKWIAGLVLYMAALLYLVPQIVRTVATIEDIDKISGLFEQVTRKSIEGVAGADLGPAAQKRAGELRQPTGDLRELYVLARARLVPFRGLVERLARAGRAPGEAPRETLGPKLKGLLRAREKIAMDYDGDASHLRDCLRASVVCDAAGELPALAEELLAIEAEGAVRVVQVKNRFVGEPCPSGYRDVNVNLRLDGLVVELQIHLRDILTIADRQHVAYEYAREMDLMGVLEKPEEEEEDAGGQRRQPLAYLVARLVPAVLSAAIGWLYVDAFTLKGLIVVVKRASLLPMRGFRPPFVVLRVYGLVLAAPYWMNTFLLARAAGCFGEAARLRRKEKSRVSVLYARNFGYEGTFFVWKIFFAQMFEVALQAYGKIPLLLAFAKPFKCSRAFATPRGKATRGSRAELCGIRAALARPTARRASARPCAWVPARPTCTPSSSSSTPPCSSTSSTPPSCCGAATLPSSATHRSSPTRCSTSSTPSCPSSCWRWASAASR